MPSIRRAAAKSKQSTPKTKNSSAKKTSRPAASPDTSVKGSKSSSPPPFQVVSDLIDATSHEILLLEGEDEESMAPWSSFDVLANRLDCYMDQYLDGFEEDEENGDESFPKLKDASTRYRFELAVLALKLCAGAAYPQNDPTGNRQKPLIDYSADEWSELREKLGKLHEQLKAHKGGAAGDVTNAPTAGQSTMESLFESLNCQMEALQALDWLRTNLRAFASESDEDDDSSLPSLQSIATLIDDYLENATTIQGHVLKGHLDCSTDFFVIDDVLSTIVPSTDNETAKECAKAAVETIDNVVSEKVYPLLDIFQVKFFRLLKLWENMYLQPPTLFKLGYFNYKDTTSPEARAIHTAPVSPSATSTSISGGKMAKERQATKRKEVAIADEELSDDDLPIVIKQVSAKAKPVVKSPGRTRTKRKKLADEKQSPIVAPKPRRKRSMAKYSHDAFEFIDGENEPKRSRVPYKCSHDEFELSDGENEPKRSRVPYSDEEKEALIRGLQKYGEEKSKWALILGDPEFAKVFKLNKRTNVNLKDLYRTMEKNGQV